MLPTGPPAEPRSRSDQSSVSSAPTPSPQPPSNSVCTPTIYVTDAVTPSSETSTSSSRKSKKKFPDLRCLESVTSVFNCLKTVADCSCCSSLSVMTSLLSDIFPVAFASPSANGRVTSTASNPSAAGPKRHLQLLSFTFHWSTLAEETIFFFLWFLSEEAPAAS